MTPLELLARLAALVPPPRYPLVRYHGVLAPHSAWRSEIVPRPPTDSSMPGVVRLWADSPARQAPAGVVERRKPWHVPPRHDPDVMVRSQ